MIISLCSDLAHEGLYSGINILSQEGIDTILSYKRYNMFKRIIKDFIGEVAEENRDNKIQ